MAFSHTVGGTTFTEASFEGNAYANEDTGFAKALEKMVEHVANAYRGTSTTSNAVGTGSKTWTVTNANSQIPAFAVGMPVRVARTSDPSNTYMQGEITAWTAATGAATINVSSSKGSGTHTDWTVTVGGNQTTASASPLAIADGGTGAATAAAAKTNLGLDGLYARNLIINGDMRVAQKGTSFTGQDGASGTGNRLDMWRISRLAGSEAGRFTITQENSGGPAGFSNWLKCLVTTAESAVAAGEGMVLETKIEAQNLQHLAYGNAAAAGTVMQCQIIVHADGASSLTFPVKVGMFAYAPDGTRSFVHEASIAAADTWQTVSFTIAGDTAGTINNDTGAGLQLGAVLYAGSTYHATADQWAAGNDRTTANQDNLADAVNNYIGITSVQFEVGAAATAFEHRPIADELDRCRRYYRRWTFAGDENFLSGYVDTGTSTKYAIFASGIEMRAAPTWGVSGVTHFQTLSDAAAAITTNLTFSQSGKWGAIVTATDTGTHTAGQACMLAADGTAGRYFDADAEL